jgi:hypothetical protein
MSTMILRAIGAAFQLGGILATDPPLRFQQLEIRFESCAVVSTCPGWDVDATWSDGALWFVVRPQDPNDLRQRPFLRFECPVRIVEARIWWQEPAGAWHLQQPEIMQRTIEP